MAKWETISDECFHKELRTEKDLAEPIEERYNPETGLRDKYYICHPCANGERGFCHNTVLHPILTARRIWEH
jgi:hypothetical protein